MRHLWNLFSQSVIGGTLLGILAAFVVLFLWSITGQFPTVVPEFDSSSPDQAIYLTSLPIPDMCVKGSGDAIGVLPFPSRLPVDTVNPAAAGE